MGETAGIQRIEIRPHEGPQEMFLATSADIGIGGGAAGGGKTWDLIVEPLRHVHNPGFGGVIFRRTSPQITNEGGLWDESHQIYPYFEGVPYSSHPMHWVFPSGAKVGFHHMQHEDTKHDWMGAQIPYIGWDQLEHFTESQFFYMLSRNRSMCGVRPYIRATVNPDPDSWVAEFIAWWIDQETGYPIPERQGVIRWFVRVENEIVWADTREELEEKYPDTPPTSVTFIHMDVYDNPTLLKANPDYVAKLKALPLVERERLLGGNWKIRHTAGKVFNRGWFKTKPAAPKEKEGIRWVRYWDKAGTEDGGAYSAGALVGLTENGITWIADVVRGQWSARERETTIHETAKSDRRFYGPQLAVWVEQEPGSGGKESAEATIRRLQGFDVHADRVTGDKVARAAPLSSQAEAGNVCLVEGEWNKAFLDELHAFPDGKFKDQVDAACGAYNKLAGAKTIRPSWRVRKARAAA